MSGLESSNLKAACSIARYISASREEFGRVSNKAVIAGTASRVNRSSCLGPEDVSDWSSRIVVDEASESISSGWFLAFVDSVEGDGAYFM